MHFISIFCSFFLFFLSSFPQILKGVILFFFNRKKNSVNIFVFQNGYEMKTTGIGTLQNLNTKIEICVYGGIRITILKGDMEAHCWGENLVGRVSKPGCRRDP